jgi:NAD(P)-dependent dehydrogenase (short-subunit alcohol dehydrogenase family)
VDLGLADATAVVIGGTRGIGQATARSLAAEGCRVAVIGRRDDALALTATELKAVGARDVLTLRANARSTEEITGAFDVVGARWDSLNVLVNAVGPASAGRLEELDDDGWSAAFEGGTVSAVRGVRAALPLLRAAPWARIVNLTAMSIQHQSPYLVSYTAAKSALLSITKNLARSLAPEGILVNAVAPGPILTEWAAKALGAAASEDPVTAYEQLQQAYGMSVDLGRLGLADEVASVVTFCASPRNGFMTGAHINVDGGSDFD